VDAFSGIKQMHPSIIFTTGFTLVFNAFRLP
jgi:hypothetical protein